MILAIELDRDILHTLLGLAVCLLIVGIAAATASPSRERPTARPALRTGQWVEIDAGPHRGLAGFVADVFLDCDTGRFIVTVHLQGGGYVTVPREDMSPVTD